MHKENAYEPFRINSNYHFSSSFQNSFKNTLYSLLKYFSEFKHIDTNTWISLSKIKQNAQGKSAIIWQWLLYWPDFQSNHEILN